MTAPAPGSDRRLSGEAHQVGRHSHRSDHEPHESVPGIWRRWPGARSGMHLRRQRAHLHTSGLHRVPRHRRGEHDQGLSLGPPGVQPRMQPSTQTLADTRRPSYTTSSARPPSGLGVSTTCKRQRRGPRGLHRLGSESVFICMTEHLDPATPGMSCPRRWAPV